MRRRPSSFLTSLLSSPSPKSAAEPSDLMAAQTGPEQPAQPRSSPPEPQSSQNGNDGGDESPRQKEKHARWCGYLEEGRWYCECNLRVRPLTVKKRGPNYGKQFHRCPNSGKQQCLFSLWFDDEAEAREWTKTNPPTIRPNPGEPRTPGGGPSKEGAALKDWLSGKKRSIDESAGEQAEPENAAHNEADEEEEPVAGDGSPAHKSVKFVRSSTPRQNLTEKFRAAASSLPTPETNGKGKEEAEEYDWEHVSRPGSPTPVQLGAAIHLRGESSSRRGKEPDLATHVLKLIRCDNIRLRASTEGRVRMTIELEEVRSQARINELENKAAKQEETISNLFSRLDELENTVDLLTGGGAADEVIELSD